MPEGKKRGKRETPAGSAPEKPKRGSARDGARESGRARMGSVAAPPRVRAIAKYLRSSPRKVRLVADHIRGKDVPKARAVLRYTPRAAARDVAKVLESAVANAENNHELVGDEMRVCEIRVDEGPTMKRFRPRAMGRSSRIRKRTCHLTITLTPKD